MPKPLRFQQFLLFGFWRKALVAEDATRGAAAAPNHVPAILRINFHVRLAFLAMVLEDRFVVAVLRGTGADLHRFVVA